MKINRGDIFMADLGRVVGSEQSGRRPVLVIQNDVGNQYSPTIIVASITSSLTKASLPTHVYLPVELNRPSIILLEQVRTLDKSRLHEKLSSLSFEKMREVDRAILISMGCVHPLFKEI